MTIWSSSTLGLKGDNNMRVRHLARKAREAAPELRCKRYDHRRQQHPSHGRCEAQCCSRSQEWAAQRNLPVLAYLALRQGVGCRLRKRQRGAADGARLIAVPAMLARWPGSPCRTSILRRDS